MHAVTQCVLFNHFTNLFVHPRFLEFFGNLHTLLHSYTQSWNYVIFIRLTIGVNTVLFFALQLVRETNGNSTVTHKIVKTQNHN